MGYIWENYGIFWQKLWDILVKNYGIYWPKTIGDISIYIWKNYGQKRIYLAKNMGYIY